MKFKNLIRGISVAFWKWYLRLEPQAKKTVVGIPYHRDPNDVCEFYEPFKRARYSFQDCQGNGHYLCTKCYHYQPEEIEEEVIEEPKETLILKNKPKCTSWEAKFKQERSSNEFPVNSIYDLEHIVQ